MNNNNRRTVRGTEIRDTRQVVSAMSIVWLRSYVVRTSLLFPRAATRGGGFVQMCAIANTPM